MHYIAVVPPLWRPLMMTGGNATWQSHCCPTLLGNQVPRSHIAVLAGFTRHLSAFVHMTPSRVQLSPADVELSDYRVAVFEST